MPLPAALTLARSHKITHGDQTESGPLVADEKGIGVDVTTWEKRSLMKKAGTTRRYYVMTWEAATDYTIEPAATKMLGGSTTNSHTVVLTLTSPEKVFAVELHATSVAQTANRLGAFLAKVKSARPR